VFRKISPYSWPGGVATILNHNTQRIADVWMDEYKDFFYKTNPGRLLLSHVLTTMFMQILARAVRIFLYKVV